VLELSSQGYNQIEIATNLQVDKSIISRDMTYLRQQAQENLQRHIHEVVPEEYKKAAVGINQVLSMAWSIVSKDIDNRTKLDALRLINDCNKYKMDLCTNAGVISEAMKYVTHKQEQIDMLRKIDERMEAAEEEDSNKTTEGVY
jgi:methionine synthase II (cobalamin-independent)